MFYRKIFYAHEDFETKLIKINLELVRIKI